jgi:hypothetical protein
MEPHPNYALDLFSSIVTGTLHSACPGQSVVANHVPHDHTMDTYQALQMQGWYR